MKASVTMKATLIMAILIVVVVGAVYLLVYGINRDPAQQQVSGGAIPSEETARAYVEDRKLLATVDKTQAIHPGGPSFMMITGKDASGQEKVVWLAGKPGEIKEYGSVLTKDGKPRDQILAELAKKGIPESELDFLYISPYDYTSGKIAWFAQEKGTRDHMLWYDFQTGEQFWEAYGNARAVEREKGK
ncbi:hypothetical protein J31TS4_31590 [Paenibacillus sp. J31TS4]|uniref:hypothetical protein n=1 Tax=Paenibacillus sp. J31TS4 TaxID=2807195 RepID=UPI001B17145C|nr:hypothetical protein [Paenibacillus sp. J31TS4]GIP39879.1 hypothetical protein J31TS4_31590 [Paenibacillus sp. J31TS4]